MRTQVVVEVGWGSDALPSAGSFVAHSRSGAAGADTSRLRRPILPVRAALGRVLVLHRDPDGADRLLEVDPAGGLARWFPLPDSGPGDVVVDFAPDAGAGAYALVDASRGSRAFSARLLRVSSSGDIDWEQALHRFADTFSTAPVRGRFGRLHVTDLDEVLLSSNYPASGVVAFHSIDGTVAAGYEWGEQFDRLAVGPDGDAYYSRRVEAEGGAEYVIVRRSPRTADDACIVPGVPGLPQVASVDRLGRLYLEGLDHLTVLSHDGSLHAEVDIAGAAVHPKTGEVHLARLIGDVGEPDFEVHRFGRAGEPVGTVRLRWADALRQGLRGLPRLVGIAADGELLAQVGDTDDTGGALTTFDELGRLTSVRSLDAGAGQRIFEVVDEAVFPLESQCGPTPTWAVDSEGRIYVPVSDPAGFKLLRIEL